MRLSFMSLAVSCFLHLQLFSQAPEKMTYQATIYNAGGKAVVEKAVAVRIRILKGSANGTIVFAERHEVTT
ncbi:MAG: hypothetical protein IPF79_08910 [Ignavibacteria bacterium]|nr:hypothetical protein [Ignavibacteria bacterium]